MDRLNQLNIIDKTKNRIKRDIDNIIAEFETNKIKFDKIKIGKEIYIPILGIVIGELLILYNKIFYGLGVHIINLLVIISIIIFYDISDGLKNILQSMTLIILLRIINLSVPPFFTTDILQYSIIYGIMFIPIYSIIKNQQISNKELGMHLDRFYIYLPMSILIGFIIAVSEYNILDPIPLIENIDIPNIILITIIMFVFVGTIEEIIFRPILQTRIEKSFGSKNGILLSGGIFGIMHSSYGISNEIIFATIFGIVLGYIFYMTRDVLFAISIHGIANVISFGILPNLNMITTHSSDIIAIGGGFMTLLLIVILIISILMVNTKYWNKYISNTLDTCSNCLLLTFITIVIFRVIMIT